MLQFTVQLFFPRANRAKFSSLYSSYCNIRLTKAKKANNCATAKSAPDRATIYGRCLLAAHSTLYMVGGTGRWRFCSSHCKCRFAASFRRYSVKTSSYARHAWDDYQTTRAEQAGPMILAKIRSSKITPFCAACNYSELASPSDHGSVGNFSARSDLV